MTTITEKLRKFVVDSFLFGQSNGLPSDDTSFLAAGILSSTGVLELVAFLEREFAFRVRDEELIPENFDSVERLTAYVESRTAVKS